MSTSDSAWGSWHLVNESSRTRFSNWYLRKVKYSAAIATSAPTAEIKNACVRWASALGWEHTDSGTGPLTFRPGWLLWTFSGLEMQVSNWEVDGHTQTQFTASAQWNLPGYEDDLWELARQFAEGVDLELREAGFAVESVWERLQPSKRSRLARAERWRRRFTLVALVLLIPASLAMWLLTESGFIGYLTGLWILMAIMTSAEVVRRRLLGMRATFFVVMVALLWAAVLLVMTPIFVFIALGKL